MNASSLQSICMNYISQDWERTFTHSFKQGFQTQKKPNSLPSEVSNPLLQKLIYQLQPNIRGSIALRDWLPFLHITEFDGTKPLSREAVQLFFHEDNNILEKMQKIILRNQTPFNLVYISKVQYKDLKEFILLNPKDVTKEQLLALIQKLPEHLETFTIANCQAFDNEVVLQLSKSCPNIVDLKITCTSMTTFEGCNFKQLISVDISSSRLTNQGLQALSLQSGRSITTLDLYETSINSFSNCSFTALKNLFLKNLEIDNKTLQEISRQCGASLKALYLYKTAISSLENTAFNALETFSANTTQLSNSDLVLLANCSGETLRKLVLKGSNISICKNLAFPRLHTLRISTLHQEDIQGLGDRCPNLQYLDLEGNDDISSLQGMGCKKLRCAVLNKTKIKDEDVRLLAEENPHLEELDLEDTHITTLKGVPLKKLKILNLNETQIAPDGLSSITTDCPLLEKLLIEETAVTGFTAPPTLKQLHAGYSMINTEGLKKICSSAQNLEYLDITEIGLDQGLLDVPFNFKFLTSLSMCLLPLTNQDLVHIGLGCGKSLKVLDISFTNIGTISEFPFTRLRELDVQDTRFTTSDFRLISRQSCRTTLQSINISQCQQLEKLPNYGFPSLNIMYLKHDNLRKEQLASFLQRQREVHPDFHVVISEPRVAQHTDAMRLLPHMICIQKNSHF